MRSNGTTASSLLSTTMRPVTDLLLNATTIRKRSRNGRINVQQQSTTGHLLLDSMTSTINSIVSQAAAPDERILTGVSNINNSTIGSDDVSLVPFDASLKLRDDQWTAPIIALAGVNMITILLFEVFVLYKACRTSPSRRHLFLGQMLLLGLFLSSALGVAFAVRPTWWTCSVIRAGLGVCYSLVLATLLVKTVFLISLHSGIYLPAEYQALLLFFVVITQVAIDAQWLINQTSAVIIDHVDAFGSVISRCDHSMSSLLLSLIYDMFLMSVVSFLALKAKGHRENHGEALFIAITVVCSVILWCVWIAGAVTSISPTDRDAFVAFGVVGNATLVFLVMFLPKGRQLAAMGRDGASHRRHSHDDRDQLSSPSSPSVYTPSFLHIKPSMPTMAVPTLTVKPPGFHNNNNNIGYKPFNGTANGHSNGSSGQATGSGRRQQTMKSMVSDRFYYLPPPPSQPPPPPPGHRVWRTGCYPPVYPAPPALAVGHHHHEEFSYYPFETHAPHGRNHHHHQIAFGNPNVKFFRAPCY